MATAVGILAGGRTTERETTQGTSSYLAKSLQESGYIAEVLLIDTISKDLTRTLEMLQRVEIVFPLISGLEGFLAALDVAYVGSMPLAAALGAHKGIFNDLLHQKGLKSVKYWYGSAADAEAAVQDQLSLPVFVKPCRLGASSGVSRVDSWSQLRAALSAACAHDREVLVEESVLTPLREFEVCGVVGSDRTHWSDPFEIILPVGTPWHDTESKYSGKTGYAPVRDHRLRTTLQDLAATTVSLAEFRGAIRVDLFTDCNGVAGVGEINCVPGFGPHSDTPRIYEESGVSRVQLYSWLIDSAKAAREERAGIRYSM